MTKTSSGEGGRNSELDVWTMGKLEVTPSPAEATDPHSVWVKIGLTGLFLALAAPLVGLGGLWATALLSRLAAEGLQVSRANLPAIPLDTHWDLRLVYLLALVTMGLRAGVSRLPKSTWRAIGLGPWSWWLLLGAGLGVASGTTLALEQRVLDLADGVHLVVLGGTWLWSMTTVMWLLASAGHSTIVGLALASRHYRPIGGVAVVGGLTSMAVVTPVLANPDLIHSSDVHRDAPMLAGALSELDNAEHTLMGLMVRGPTATTTATAAAPSRTSNASDEKAATARCLEEVVTPRGPGERSIAASVVAKLRGRFANVSDEIADVVYWRMIDVCVDARDRTPDELTAYLYTLSRNRLVDVVRKRGAAYRARNELGQRRAQCLIDGRDVVEDSFVERQNRRATVAHLLGEMPDYQRGLLQERYLERRSFEAMARTRGRTVGAVAKATNRAVRDLRTEAKALCH